MKPTTMDHRHLMSQIRKRLQSEQANMINFFGDYPSVVWNLNDDIYQRIAVVYRDVFQVDKSASSMGKAVRGISRGVYLIDAALSWNKARVGSDHSEVAGYRGSQWRLLIAWAGLEQILQATLEGVGCKHLTLAASLGPHLLKPPLPPPSESRYLATARKWASSGQRHPILDYLNVGKGYSSEMLQRWLVEGKPLKRVEEILGLAQALRHSTAHGALSSSLVRNWQLQPAFDPLLINLGGTAANILSVFPRSEGLPPRRAPKTKSQRLKSKRPT